MFTRPNTVEFKLLKFNERTAISRFKINLFKNKNQQFKQFSICNNWNLRKLGDFKLCKLSFGEQNILHMK